MIFKTDQGKIRQQNEDNGGVFKNKNGDYLAIVADGMGGHNAGEVASRMAVSALLDVWSKVEEPFTPEKAENWFLSNVKEVNQQIYRHSLEVEECSGMGTTIVAAICTDLFATVVNIGDSRCYILNESGFSQLTEDHSLLNELIKTGQISREDAEQHPRKNILLKALGTEEHVEMDVRTITFEEENKLLLCSDGLSNKVTVEEMAQVLESDRSLDEKATTLINRANQKGGEDNITLAIIEYESDESGCEEC
ncbi:Stp1/IreP family PP2C-type Ser/Thr phosphatase [Bacillus sp. FJAT-50079]|nr:Stp1/IreP family PP2C-type Ser/Thr phosphatase [Bacillus sp. FJAT-50079]